jgi:hypothetical protein
MATTAAAAVAGTRWPIRAPRPRGMGWWWSLLLCCIWVHLVVRPVVGQEDELGLLHQVLPWVLAEHERGAVTSPPTPSFGFGQTLTSYVQLMAKQTSTNVFLPLLMSSVRDKDIVMLKRFYSEDELSFATVQKTPLGLSTMIRSISALPIQDNGTISPSKPTNVPAVAWTRTPTEYMVYTKRIKYPSNFGELSENARQIIKAANGTKKIRINALRYHLRMKACHFVSTLGGNPSYLPVPVVFTTPLNENYGIYSSDVLGKTCHPDNFDFQNNACRGTNDQVATMALCDKDPALFKRFLDKNKNIALILTCQHHFFSHTKLLSLPLGIREVIEPHVQRFYSQHKSQETYLSKTRLGIASTEGLWYQDKVSGHLRSV